MASPPSRAPYLLAERAGRVRWPATQGRRALLRLALSTPYVGLSIWLAVHGFRSVQDEEIAHAARALGTSSVSLGALVRTFPPLAPLVSRLLPGGARSLGIVGALCTGGTLHLCWERLVRACVPRWLVAVLVGAAGGSPIFWFVATGETTDFVSVALLTVAIARTFDFLYLGSTTGGYAAGCSLALTVLWDPGALVYVGGVAIAIPFLAWERVRREPGVSRSAIAVVIFPTVAAVSAWVFLVWRFAGHMDWSLLVSSTAFGTRVGALHGLAGAATQLAWQVCCAPVVVIGTACLLEHRPIPAIGVLVVLSSLFASSWLALRFSGLDGVVLLDVVGFVTVPAHPPRVVAVSLAAASVAGLALSVMSSLSGGPGHLLHALGLWADRLRWAEAGEGRRRMPGGVCLLPAREVRRLEPDTPRPQEADARDRTARRDAEADPVRVEESRGR